MGSISIERKAKGRDIKEVFDIIVKEDEKEYGTGYYNGSFANAFLVRQNFTYDLLKIKSEKEREKRLQEIKDDWYQKRGKNEVGVVALGISHYAKNSCIQTKVQDPATLKFEIVYVVEGENNRKDFKSLSQAKKYAKDFVLNSATPVTIKKVKKTRMDGEIWNFSPKVETSKRKVKDSVVVYDYLFFGWASY